MADLRVWSVEIVLSEDEERTRADAHLHAGSRDFCGFGRSRRNPIDPDVPIVGEELAVSRALGDLSHQLFEAAFDVVEQFSLPSSS
jgi:hypothetical protein